MFSCPDGIKSYENKYCKTLNFLRQRSDTQERDFRYNWPAQIFTHVCKCTGNWIGYDCSRCKRGYGGPDCTVKQDPVVRRSFLDLSTSEKNRIIEILSMSKHMESNFTVPIEEPPTGTDSFRAYSLFDVFATFHYYTIRDESLKDTLTAENKVPDFAHEGPGFLPWHRAYLLYFETELQYMLNDHTFALPYWDWTAYAELKARNDSECPDIFSADLFGENDPTCFETKDDNAIVEEGVITLPKYEHGRPIITNKFNWTPVCVDYKQLTNNEQLCIPYENDRSDESPNFITRCAGSTLGKLQCRANGMLPTESDVMRVYEELEYDVCYYNHSDDINGFRNAIEGFYNFNNVDRECDFAEMHNKVHLYIGGLMMDVPTSSNDPIFWLHHCNIDRLYERWLANPNADILYKPAPNDNSVEYGIGFGHNGNDNAGLLFPPITNVAAHKQASEFGYSYRDPVSCTIDATLSTSGTSSTSSIPSTSSTITHSTSNPGGTDPTPGGTDPTSRGTNPTTRDGTTSAGASSLHQSYLVYFAAGYSIRNI